MLIGYAHQNIIELVYGKNTDYILKLNAEGEEANFIDVTNEFGNVKKLTLEEVIGEYLPIDKKNKEGLYQIILELEKRCNTSKKEIAQALGISRATLFRLLKEKRNNSQ